MLYCNKQAVIFCPDIDKHNEWKTVVCNPLTEELFEINKEGYFLLKQIADTPGIEKSDLEIKNGYAFIDLMIRESIILEKLT